MKFPLDNDSRRTSGVKTAAIHDATGKIVMQVSRVMLCQERGESVQEWLRREERATVERATAVVRLLNAGYGMVRATERHLDQDWLPGVDRPDEGED